MPGPTLFTPPHGADCHAHVFNPARFAYAPDTPYIPTGAQAGTPAQFLATLDAHGLSHGLVVSPAPYGLDNACMFDAIAGSQGRLKGIALVAHDVSEQEIERLAQGGVVGIRINLCHDGLAPLTRPDAPALLARLKNAGWFCQIHYEKDQLAQVLPVLRESGVRVMLDHCGRPDPALGIGQPGFAALLELGRSGNAVVKLSGDFRFSREDYPYADTDRFFRAAIEAYTPDNCVWGSDWPFVRTSRVIDYGQALGSLTRWLNDADLRKVLWDTPARLFGFR